MKNLIHYSLLLVTFDLSHGLYAQVSTPRASREFGMIDPAAFGFGKPGFVSDVSWIDTQHLDDQTGSLDYTEWRMIAPLGAKKAGIFYGPHLWVMILQKLISLVSKKSGITLCIRWNCRSQDCGVPLTHDGQRWHL
jgi:hypothetical protein